MSLLAVQPAAANDIAQDRRYGSVWWAVALLVVVPVVLLAFEPQPLQFQSGTGTCHYVLPLLLFDAVAFAFIFCWRSICSSNAGTTTKSNARPSRSSKSASTITDDDSRDSNCRCSTRNRVRRSDSPSGPHGHRGSTCSSDRMIGGTGGCKLNTVYSSGPSSSNSRSSGGSSGSRETGEDPSESIWHTRNSRGRSAVCRKSFCFHRLWKRCNSSTCFLLCRVLWCLLALSLPSEATRFSRLYSRAASRGWQHDDGSLPASLAADEQAQQWDALPPEHRQLALLFNRDGDVHSRTNDGRTPAFLLYFSPATPEDALPAAAIDFNQTTEGLQGRNALPKGAMSSFVSLFKHHFLWTAVMVTTFLAVTDVIYSIKAHSSNRKARRAEQRRIRRRAALHEELRAVEKQLQHIERRVERSGEDDAEDHSVAKRLRNVVARLEEIIEQLHKAKGVILQFYAIQLRGKARRLLRQHTRFGKERRRLKETSQEGATVEEHSRSQSS